jgi:glycosyltransferase involved in cell wall biosynthesis
MKFSIVTPSFNSEKYIAETIECVLSQKGDFEIEYIIVDNCSDDNTVDIIKKYDNLLRTKNYDIKCNAMTLKYISEPDNGMYEALNKGFSLATGDIYAWINANDIYLPGAFAIVVKTFVKYTQIVWLKGITSYINENSTSYKAGKCLLYEQRWIQKGVYGRDAYFIQQDSVFWRADLWRRAGSFSPGLKLAGDYFLWKAFSQTAVLYSLNAYVSCFRKVDGQLSQNVEAYRRECKEITGSDNYSERKIEYYFHYEPLIPDVLRPFIYRLMFGDQNLHLVELMNGDEPVLGAASYYIA